MNNPWDLNLAGGLFNSEVSRAAIQSLAQPQPAGPVQNTSGGDQQINYPTYPNQYGFGSQIEMPVAEQTTVSGATQKGNLTKQPQSESSHGFNPWSMMGESNAR